MSEIANLQRRFQEFVLSSGNDMRDAIVGDELAPAATRLAVYFDAYRLRLLGILQTEFPGVGGLITADQFREIGLGYLDTYPSNFTSVRWFAGSFARYVETVQAELQVPNLAEMAHFEWARGRAFDAVSAPALEPERLAQLPPDRWPSMQIDVVPSAQRLPFVWNTDELWRAIKAGDPLPDVARRATPGTCCVWRRELTVYWRVMDAAEAAALESFALGNEFAQVCTMLCEFRAEAEVPALAASLLSTWIGEGLVAGIRS